MTTLRVDLDAIAGNWSLLARLHGAPTAAVVKADAYGLGAARVGARLHQAGARHFFVAHLGEGILLRPHVQAAMIGVLNGLSPDGIDAYLAHDLAPVIGTIAELEAWSAKGREVRRNLPALLHLDTGMNRLGFSSISLEELARRPDLLDGVRVLYLMTHLANAEQAENPGNAEQLRRFEQGCAMLPPAPRSIANSSALFLGGAFRSDLARPGAALYGINPVPGYPNPMQPALRLTGRVLQLRCVKPGEAVGYNGIWTAQRTTRVATVAAGYADGYHRVLSNTAEACFDGARLPLIGRVSMDLTTFDATDQPGVVQGSELELIGPAVPPDEVAGWAGTNGYEVLTGLKPRHARLYAAL